MKFVFPATRKVNRAKAADAVCQLLFLADKRRWYEYAVLLGLSPQTIFSENFGKFLKNNGHKIRRSRPILLPGSSSKLSYDYIKGRVRLWARATGATPRRRSSLGSISQTKP